MKIKALKFEIIGNGEDGELYCLAPSPAFGKERSARIYFEEGKYWAVWGSWDYSNTCPIEGYDDPKALMDIAQSIHDEWIRQFLEE